MSEENKKRKIVDRKVVHSKDDKFNTYVRVLQFMIENKGKAFTNSEIREKLFTNESKNTSIKNMVSKCVDFYVSSSIFTKVTHLIDDNLDEVEVILTKDDYDEVRKVYEVEFNGKDVDVKLPNVKNRLYDKNIDGVDENGEYYDDYYVVDLHIPKKRGGVEKLCETVASMITSIPNADIYTPTIKTVLESQLFGLQTSFVAETITKAILKHHNIRNEAKETAGQYPLDLILSVINSKVSVNVEFENFGNTIRLNNTKIKKITIKENGFDVYFDNFISQNQSDIKQIKLIENSSEDGLLDDIEKLKELLKDKELDESTKKVIENILSFENGLDFFFQNEI